MALTHPEIDQLLGLLRHTRDQEIDCGQCLAHVAEFVEHRLAGRSIPEGLEAVGHHLRICVECREEYEALRRALESLDSGAESDPTSRD